MGGGGICIHTNRRLKTRGGVYSSLQTQMTCVGRYEIKPLIYEKFIKKNKCIHTNGMLEMGSRNYTKNFQ